MPKRENAQAIPAKREVLALLGILYVFFFHNYSTAGSHRL